jgi:polyisoprenoid-binding protein YceI
MRNNRLASFAALFLAVGSSSLALGAPDSFKIDPIHSDVVFTIKHLASRPSGVFRAPEGTVVQDGGVPALDVSLPLDKLDMGNKKWETDLKSASWFDEKQFPTITFKTTAVKKLGKNPETGDFDFEATGDLTLHGVTKSITVTLNKLGEEKGMKGELHIGYQCMFKINRSDFGMTTMKGPIGDEVSLHVNIEAVPG